MFFNNVGGIYREWNRNKTYPTITDEEVRQWSAKMNAYMLQKNIPCDQSSVFGDNSGQYVVGTKLEGASNTLQIIGSHWERDTLMSSAEDFVNVYPAYDVVYSNSNEIQTLDMEDAHKRYRVHGMLETILKTTRIVPTAVDFLARRVVYLGVPEYLLSDNSQNSFTRLSMIWKISGIQIDILDDCRDFLNSTRLLCDYGTIVIEDGFLRDKLLKLAPMLRDYFRQGGLVIVLGCTGIFSMPKELSTIFGCKWEFGGYTQYECNSTEEARHRFKRLPDKIPRSKQNYVRVPRADALFYANEYVGKNDKATAMTPAAVYNSTFATAQNVAGCLAYFSCINWEPAFAIALDDLVNGVYEQCTNGLMKKTESIKLDEQVLDRMAVSNDWTKHNTHNISCSTASYVKEDKMLTFWLSTGTVGSYLNHPVQGKTQLFRRSITHSEAEQLFKQPRTHTGKGYQKRKRGEQAHQEDRGKSSSGRVCVSCNKRLAKTEFSATQWKRKTSTTSRCKSCV